MVAYWWYILKVSVCVVVFYTFYAVVLRRCTFFLLNRLYLIFGLILSFTIPALNFSALLQSQSNSALSAIAYPFLIEPENNFFQPVNVSNYDATISYTTILSIAYFIGISTLLVKLLLSTVKIIRVSSSSETYRIGRKKIVRMESSLPFSFFNTIFLPKGEDNPMIVEHEAAHVSQLHWLDLMLAEVASVLLWFNPFVFLYKNSLKLQHEYLADTSVVKDKSRVGGYLDCMLRQIQVVGSNGMVSQFYCKTIKKRVIMITKNQTSKKYLGLYLLALPLVCLMLLAFSSSKSLAQGSKVVQENVVSQPSIYPIDVKKARLAAGYEERVNPVTKKKAFHYGIDFAIAEGENIVSTADGIVVEAELDSQKGRGNYIVIKHNDTFSTFYSHLKSISVQVGDKVKQGQVVGYVGSTGMSTGPHLHYEVIKNGERVNPKDYLPK